jgi:hypothetical protein
MTDRPKCKLCGLEDGACICAHLPPRSSAATTGPLLPCPFCGSKPVRFWTSDYQQLAQVRCENDDCFGPSTPVASVRDADRMWNRRISVPAQAPTVCTCAALPEPPNDDCPIHGACETCGAEVGAKCLFPASSGLDPCNRAAQPPAAPVETLPRWCPGCSRNVDEICHHFNCAVGPHGLDAQIRAQRSSAGNSEPAEVEEDDPDVLTAARAIAEHGFGRPWDDFHVSNAFDTDQNDLIEYGRAAVSALRSRALPQTAPSREDIARVIGGDIFHGSDDGVGPATRHARVEALKKADAILALSRPVSGGGQ